MVKIILKVLICLTLVLSVFSCKKDEKSLKKEIIRPVRYKKVYSTGGERVRTFSGTSKAGMEAKLSFKVGGTISKILVKVGDKIKKGDDLAILDSKDYRLQLAEANAGYNQIKVKVNNAEKTYNRMRKLYENQNVSKNDLDTAKAGYDGAKAGLNSIAQKIELAKARVAYTKLTAPFDGAVSVITSKENENIRQGYPAIFLTGDTKPEVEISVPEMLISEVKKGVIVKIKFNAIKNEIFEGTINEVGVATSQYATTYPVTIVLNNTSSIIKPGMVADVQITFISTKKEVIVVPPISVTEDSKGRYVYIAVPEKGELAKVRRVNVKTGDLTSLGIEIIEGLKEDELVITAGISKLKDGMKVKVLDLNKE